MNDFDKYDQNVILNNIGILCEDYSYVFALNKCIQRAIVSLDGLKPGGRAILYTLYTSGQKIMKVASLSGATIKIHPHSDSALYGTIVGMVQDWENNMPLLDPGGGEGNFGSRSGDEAAAGRYISVELSKFAQDCYFRNFKESCPKMIWNYDETIEIPDEIPTKYPVILFNPSEGIAYAKSSSIPGYNPKEVLEITLKLLENPNYKGYLIPDSPSYANIVRENGTYGFKDNFQQIFENGYGYYVQRSTYQIDFVKNIVVITSLPMKVILKDVLFNIEQLKRDNVSFHELEEIQDLSGREKGIWVEFKLRKGCNPYTFLKKLYNNTPFQKTFNANVNIVQYNNIVHYSIRNLILEWIRLRLETLNIVLVNKLTNYISEQNIINIKLFILDGNHLEETTRIFKQAYDKKDLIKRLVDRYGNDECHMTSQQAESISRMTSVEFGQAAYNNYLKRAEELIGLIIDLKDLINNNGDMITLKKELNEGIKLYNHPRRSKVVDKDIKIDHYDSNEYVILLSENKCNIRKISMCDISNEDRTLINILPPNHIEIISNNSDFLIIDKYGNYDIANISDIPTNVEVPVVNFINKIESEIIDISSLDGKNMSIIIITKNGCIKRIDPLTLTKKRKISKCIEVTDDDEIISIINVKLENPNSDIIIYTKNGYVQKIKSSDIKLSSGDAKGNNAVFKLNGDTISNAYKIEDREFLLYISKKGKVRLNRSKHLGIRTNKFDLIKVVDLPSQDKLFKIMNVNSTDIVRIISEDLKSYDINISELPILTMNSPLSRLNYIDADCRCINAFIKN